MREHLFSNLSAQTSENKSVGPIQIAIEFKAQ